ncbi:MAG: hypothetical protein K8R59_17395 [Thermoanaerobaculales bacterium]|nr:hypothetical protein [Thermoanaerobaculales bacterium]
MSDPGYDPRIRSTVQLPPAPRDPARIPAYLRTMDRALATLRSEVARSLQALVTQADQVATLEGVALEGHNHDDLYALIDHVHTVADTNQGAVEASDDGRAGVDGLQHPIPNQAALLALDTAGVSHALAGIDATDTTVIGNMAHPLSLVGSGVRPDYLGDDLAMKADSDVVQANLDAHAGDGTKHFTEASIDHAAIQNVGTNSHTVLDAHLAKVAENVHGVTARDVSAWEYTPDNSQPMYSLVESLANNNACSYRISLFGGVANDEKIYMQELVFTCYTGDSGSPEVRYSHIGPVAALRACVQIYWNSVTSKYEIYLVQAAAWGIPAFHVTRGNPGGHIAYPVYPGAWSSTAPTGAKVFDSSDHATYPPTLLFDPDATRPKLFGADLALHSDVTGLDHSDVGAIEDAAGAVTQSHLAAGAVGTIQVEGGAISNNKLPDMPAWTTKGNATSGSAGPTDMSGADAAKAITGGTAGKSISLRIIQAGDRITVTEGIVTAFDLNGAY